MMMRCFRPVCADGGASTSSVNPIYVGELRFKESPESSLIVVCYIITDILIRAEKGLAHL